MSIKLHASQVSIGSGGMIHPVQALTNLGYSTVRDDDLQKLESRLVFLEKYYTDAERAQQASEPVAQNNTNESPSDPILTHTSENTYFYHNIEIRTVTTTQTFITESDA